MKYLVLFLIVVSCSVSTFNFPFVGRPVENHSAQVSPDSQYAGEVIAIAEAPNGWMYTINGGDGVYLSSNRGRSWKQIGGSYILSTASCLVVDMQGRLLVGMPAYGIYTFIPSNGRWRKIDTLLNGRAIFALAVDRRNHIFAGSGQGSIYRSTDNGVHWTKLYLKDYSGGAITVGANGAIYAKAAGTFMTSNDNGDNWTTFSHFQNNISVSAHGRIYAWGDGVYLSEDTGRTWKRTMGSDTLDCPVSCLLIYQENKIFAGLETGQVRVSSDAGLTWTNASISQINQSPVLCLASNHRGYIFVGTQRSGLYRSTDVGMSWQQANKGFRAVEWGG